MTYGPMFMEHMNNTNDYATIDVHGVMVPSGEYVAALYESYAADTQDLDTSRTPEAYERNGSMNAYANTAARLAEGLWVRDIESVSITR